MLTSLLVYFSTSCTHGNGTIYIHKNLVNLNCKQCCDDSLSISMLKFVELKARHTLNKTRYNLTLTNKNLE